MAISNAKKRRLENYSGPIGIAALGFFLSLALLVIGLVESIWPLYGTGNAVIDRFNAVAATSRFYQESAILMFIGFFVLSAACALLIAYKEHR